MAATYTDPPATDEHWVRFLIEDTDVSPESDAEFTDSEITAVLGEETATGEGLKYAAAATLLSTLQIEWMKKGKGVAEKQVSKLRIRYGFGPSVGGALERKIKELRRMAAWRMMPTDRGRHLRVLRRYP